MHQADEPLRTPLDAVHVAAGAQMTVLGGWRVPLCHAGVLEEHEAARSWAAVFDRSHLGRILIRGDWAFKLLDKACTAEVVGQEDNTARRSLMCNERGGVIDDVTVIRLADQWLIVSSAANRLKVLAHLQSLNEEGGFEVAVRDQTAGTALLSVQGPEALKRLQGVLPFDVANLAPGCVMAGSFMFFKYVAARTGCTGEDGLEVILPAMAAGKAWGFITSEKGGVTPAGMGAWDVLRIEAGLPLYGHELNETIDPISAGLDFAVREGGDYVGAAALAEIRRRGPARRRVGLRLEGDAIARQGVAVLAGDREAGVVTSGTYSPSLGASIAMAYVDRAALECSTELFVSLAGVGQAKAELTPLPFYTGSAV